jgi:hypothetical protein
MHTGIEPAKFKSGTGEASPIFHASPTSPPRFSLSISNPIFKSRIVICYLFLFAESQTKQNGGV